jgi:Carboxypeptidase regulatory-like domain
MWGILTLLLLVQTPAPRASLQGRVVRLGNGDPVVRARILLARVGGQLEDYKSMLSEESGAFAFRDLAPGSYRLYAERQGYLSTEYGQRSVNPLNPLGPTGVSLTLTAGQDLKDVVLTLTPPAVVTGRVLDGDRNPLRHVWVKAMRATYRDGQRSLNMADYTESNDLGEYRLFDLPPGAYFITAVPKDRPRISGDSYVQSVIPSIVNNNQNVLSTPGADVLASGTLDPDALSRDFYPVVYYPGTTDANAAAPVDLKPGVILPGIDLTIIGVSTVRIRGTVIDGVSGQPASNVSLNLVTRPVVTLGSSTATAQSIAGKFELNNVPAGSYDLVAQTSGTQAVFARLPLDVAGRDLDNISVVLRPGVTIPGRLIFERTPSGESPAELSRAVVNMNPGYQMRANAEGNFSVANVRPGDYKFLLLAGSTIPMYLKSIRFGNADVTRGISIDGNEEGKQFEVVVSLNTATIEAQIVDDRQRPVPGAIVAVVPDLARRARSDLYRTATADASGRVRIQGIAPGEFKVFASETVDAGAWQDPSIVSIYESRGETIQLAEGERRTMTLRVLPPG